MTAPVRRAVIRRCMAVGSSGRGSSTKYLRCVLEEGHKENMHAPELVTEREYRETLQAATVRAVSAAGGAAVAVSRQADPLVAAARELVRVRRLGKPYGAELDQVVLEAEQLFEGVDLGKGAEAT